MKQPAITVFSPSYNKGKTIKRTYESLLKQTSYDFEWLIINDGSTDNTDEIVKTFNTTLFPIRYINKKNEGLNRTFNQGVQAAWGYLFFRLDTDDYVKENAIENIIRYKHLIEDNNEVCGLVFLSVFESDKLVGIHPFSEEVKRSNFFEYRYKYHAIGDRAEVIKTNVFKEIPYPVFEGEKFCPEGTMWNRIALQYDVYYVNKAIYIREYDENCITAAGAKTSINNPYGTTVYLSEILNRTKLTGNTAKMAINYYRYSLRSSFSFFTLIKKVPYTISLFGLVPGTILFLLDSINPSWVSKLKSLFHKQ